MALAIAVVFAPSDLAAQEAAPDAIFFNGKIITVDADFSVAEAIAIRGERIVAVGRDADVLQLARTGVTRLQDLGGRSVLPGLIDSHVHPGAAWSEFDHDVPSMETIPQVLAYIEGRARSVPEGSPIRVRQVFITRLRERRFPTLAELDRVAPKHPVVFSTGPDTMLNSLALTRAGIDREFARNAPAGSVETNAAGEPTGLVRAHNSYLNERIKSSERSPSAAEMYTRTKELFRDYNRAGITTVSDRNTAASSIPRYRQLFDQGDLTVRLALSCALPSSGSLESIYALIDELAEHPLRKESPWLRIVGTKSFIDGGMLTGSAYMREPWGRSDIYGIKDETYRGVLNIEPDKLLAMVRRVAEKGMQFTAHAQGDAAVETLVGAYSRLAEEMPVRDLRLSVSHSSFMSRAAIDRAAALGVVLDVQPAWLHLDTPTLVAQFGYERLRYFQPLQSLFAAGVIAGGGSDHMQKIGAKRSINPYDPFLGMWTTITRAARTRAKPLHPQEALTRRQAIEFYTRNNAHVLFWEKEIGSLEPGKRADFIVVDRDPLTCPIDDFRDTRVLQTWLDGKRVHDAGASEAFAPQTRIETQGRSWLINGHPTYRGAPAEGLLMNVRMVNAIFEDAARPEFDAVANTAEFIAKIPGYVASGVRAFTLNLQGGLPGYEGAVNSAFEADGAPREAYFARAADVIEACDRAGAAVILGCFYQRQDQRLHDEAAVRRAVTEVAKWIRLRGYRNVLLEIANEYGHRGFDHPLLKTAAGQVELIALAKRHAPGLLVSTSGLGRGGVDAEVIAAADFLLIHFNHVRVEEIPDRIAALREAGKPIVCNEDVKIGEEGARALETTVATGASWGLMLIEHNQRYPFSFDGTADDPIVYAALRRATTSTAESK